MASTSKLYKSLLQGISNQPLNDRFEGQCEDSLNLVPDPVLGLHSRPPHTFVSVLAGNDVDTVWHNYTRGEEQYLVAVTTTGVRIFDYDGVEQVVSDTAAESLAYLASGSSAVQDKLHALTLGDVTLIANSDVRVAMEDAGVYDWCDSLIYVTAPVSSTRNILVTVQSAGLPDFQVELSDVSATNATSSSDALAETIRTSLMAVGNTSLGQQRYITAGTSTDQGDTEGAQGGSQNGNTTDYSGAVSPSANKASVTTLAPDNVSYLFSDHFTVTRAGSVLLVQRTDRELVEVSIQDGEGGYFAHAINRSIDDPTRLPKNAPNNYVVRITGAGDNISDDYYLRFKADSSAFTDAAGRWQETSHPWQPITIDSETMPQGLLRMGDGTFRLQPLDVLLADDNANIFWDGRNAGDNSTNRVPDFVGHTINDMGLFQDRLYVLANESVTFSESSNYWNFFKKSVTASLAADPINKPANNNEVTTLRYGIPHNRDLIIFADDVQFRIPGQIPITASKISMSVTTSFGSELLSKPQAAGNVIFFPYRTGSFAGVREFFTESASDSNSARPITSHAKRMIKGSIRQMKANSQEDILICQASGTPNELAVYHYLWQDQERVQSAWGRWVLSTNKDIEYFFYYRSDLYIIFRDGGERTLSVMSLENSNIEGMDYNIYLDERVELSNVETSATLPTGYTQEDGEQYIAVQGPGCPNEGLQAPFTLEGDSFTFSRNMEGGVVYYGRKYSRSYQPSVPVVRDDEGNALNYDRFIIDGFEIEYTDSGPFTTIVSNPAYGTFEYKTTPFRVGSGIVGQVQLSTDTSYAPVRMPQKGLSLTYVTDSYLPWNASSLLWRGQFKKRGRSI